MYKIGIYKAGQQIAKEVFASNDLKEIEEFFKRMVQSTNNEEWDNEIFEAIDPNQAWEYKHFVEDTNNVAVFEVGEDEALHTNYTYQGCTSKMM